jgi:hypothetical protein
MQRKCIPMIVLFIFLHYLVAGCVKTTTMPKAELNDETAKCCVHELVLTTGEKYEFKDPGGQYAAISRLVTGTLNDGRKFYLDLTNENIKEIRVSTGQTISRVDLARNPDQTISEIMVGDNIYTFDQNGGKLQAGVETIHGIIKSGDEIYVPIEDIAYAMTERVDSAKSAAAFGLGVIGTILVVVVAGVIAFAMMGPSISFK